jgi:MFS family permease
MGGIKKLKSESNEKIEKVSNIKYSIILDKFKIIGNYHYIMAICTHLSMVLGYYVILSLSVQKMPPKFLCSNKNENIFNPCSMKEFCSGDYITKIDENESIDNWAYRHQLYCERDFYFQYLTSTIFFCAIFSALFMSILTDKFGRLFSYKFEVLGNFLSYVFLYYETNLPMIFTGVILNEIFSHIYNTSMIYIYEYFPTNIYVYLIVFQNINYGLIGLLASVWAEYSKDALFLIKMMMIFAIICLIFSFCILTESPDWLLSLIQHEKDEKKRKEYLTQLEDAYKKMCKFNYTVEKAKEEEENFNLQVEALERFVTPCQEHFEEHIHLEENMEEVKVVAKGSDTNIHMYHDDKVGTFGQFDRKFYKHFFLAVYLWIVNQILFYSTLTNLVVFEEKIENSTLLYFISFILANVCVAIFSNVFGVKKLIIYSCYFMSVILVFLFLITDSGNNFVTYLLPFLFFVFNFISTAVGETIYLFIPELFDPKIRSSANCYSKIPAKFFLVLAPFILGNSIYRIYTAFLVLTATAPIAMYFCI